MAWVDLSAAFGYGTKLTSTQQQNLRDNVIALKDGEELNCRIKTGTYTGDGTTDQGVTGVGFRPKYVAIWKHQTSTAAGEKMEVHDNVADNYSFTHDNVTDKWHYWYTNEFLSLDADGFSVSDAGSDAFPNKNEEVYDYLALG